MGTASPTTDRELSAALVGDYEALNEHVHRGTALATDFQQHIPGRANELTVLQQVFEKAQKDLKRLHGSIARLRQERHRLANEAMRAIAFERRLTEMTVERDRLLAEAHAMRRGLIASAGESARLKRETDAQIARMAIELGALRQSSGTAPSPPPAGADSDVRTQLVHISSILEQVLARIEGAPLPAAQKPVPAAASPSEDPAGIAIDFGA